MDVGRPCPRFICAPMAHCKLPITWAQYAHLMGNLQGIDS
jgi:hypothetical protein